MSEQGGVPSERDEIEMLLPWFVTGRLAAADATRVEGYLKQHPDLARQVQLIRDDQTATLAANEAIAIPRTLRADLAAADIARRDVPAPTRWLTVAKAQFENFFNAPTVSSVRWATGAAAVLILAKAGAFGTVGRPAAPTAYETASGSGTATTSGHFALVRFVDSADAKLIAETLGALGLVITDGPKPGGLFRVRLGASTLSEAEQARLIAALQARKDVVALVLATR